MQTLLRHVQFRPHGERLLTSSAAFWLFSAGLLVFAMASVEAIAWGYLGFLFGEGSVRWLVALFTALLIFMVVWLIDSSLITLDRAWSDHAKRILDQQVASIAVRRWRELLTFGVRISLLAASFTITAPYLAQLVFYRDIQSFVDAEAHAAINQARQSIAAKYDAMLSRADRDITAERLQYEQEVAGKGLSGRYGVGPAAMTISENLSKLEDQRASLLGDKDGAIADFDKLSADWRSNRDRLAVQYDVDVPKTSIMENRKALDALRKRPENQSTELAIKAFLAFIFAGLMLLKLFEPSSVRLYFSEVLQQEYDRYLAGSFDAMLPVTERSATASNRAAMSPQRLYEFLIRVWVPARRLEEQQAEARARSAAAAQSLDVLETMRLKINAELVADKAGAQLAFATADDASKSLTELNSAIATINTDISSFQADLAALDASAIELDEKSRFEYRSYLNRKLAEADRALAELKEALPGESERFRRADAALKVVEGRLRTKESEFDAMQSRIREGRDLLSGSAKNRVRTILEAEVR